jgi:hypothetical protein
VVATNQWTSTSRPTPHTLSTSTLHLGAEAATAWVARLYIMTCIIQARSSISWRAVVINKHPLGCRSGTARSDEMKRCPWTPTVQSRTGFLLFRSDNSEAFLGQ